MTAAEAHLLAVWRRVYSFARSRSRLVPRLSLHIGCPAIYRHRHGGDPRALFHVGHRGTNVICTIREAADLPLAYLTGLLLHEIGHRLAEIAWGRSEQEDADKSVRDFLGIRLRYRARLLIQWVSPRDVQAIMQRRSA